MNIQKSVQKNIQLSIQRNIHEMGARGGRGARAELLGNVRGWVVLESVGVMAAFLIFGFAWAAALDGPLRSSAVAPYPGSSVSDANQTSQELPAASVWLVDGYNVLHSGLLNREDRGHFWSPAHRDRLRARVECFGAPAAEIWIVFDGERAAEEVSLAAAGATITTLFAPSADDWLVRRVRDSGEPHQLAVVTADRQVAGRAQHRGAQVVSPRRFLELCPVP